jgi:5-aminolevulinate synthase
MIDIIRSPADGFIFTTSLCPHLAAGALAALGHLAHPESPLDGHASQQVRSN